MNDQVAANDEALSVASARRLDAACTRFEAAWKAPTPPRIEDFLDGWSGPDRRTLLRELVLLDVDYRSPRGMGGEDYAARFPEFDPAWLGHEASDRRALAVSPDALPTASLPPIADEAPTLDAGAPAVPRTFGNYELLAEMGRGGMGVVYKARQRGLNRDVALKVILAGQLASEQAVQRFRTEAENAASLEHPHIVPIYEVGEQDGLPFFSMKLIEGGPLSRHVARFTADPQAAARLMVTAAHAVHHAHQRGILHRDLKPANILLDDRNEPHVADLGLAKRVERRDAVTLSGAIIGTPSYMAPEQAAGRNREQTTATDVYGLGAVLYELLTGRPPFRETDHLDTMLKVIREEPVRPSRLRPGLAGDLETICMKCLEKEPKARYASAEALGRDLERFLKGEPIEGRTLRPFQKAVRWVRRHPAPAGLVAVSVLATLCLLVGWLYFTAHLQASERTTSWERDRASSEAARAQKGEANALKELNHVRRTLFTAQLWRVASIAEREPANALRFLEDDEACPADLRDFTWRLYRRRCDRQRGILVGNEDDVVKSIAFSPDAKVLASGNHDGTVRLWDLASHKVIRTLQGHQESVVCVSFNIDGNTLASGSADGTVRLWDSAGHMLAVLEGHKVVNAVTFSPDGKMIAVGDQVMVRLWEVATGRLRSQWTCSGDTHRVYSVAFTPDGASLIAWNGSDCITFWDLATGKESGCIPERAKNSSSWMALSPDGKTVVVIGGRQAPQLWDVGTRKVRQTLKGPGVQFTWPPFFTPDSQSIVAYDDKFIAFLDVHSGETRFVLDTGELIECLALSSDGAVCAAGIGNTMMLWDVSLKPCRTVPKAFGSLKVDRLSRNGQYFACNEKDGSVSVRLVETGQRWNGIAAGMSDIVVGKSSIVLSPDGQRIAQWKHHVNPHGAEKNDTTEVILWDAVRGQETARLFLPLPFPAIEYSPDGRTLATGEMRGSLHLWDATDGALKTVLTGHTLHVRLLAFAADGKTLVSVATQANRPLDGPLPVQLFVWNAATGQRIASIDWPVGHVSSVALSPDGNMLAVAGSEASDRKHVGTLRLFDIAADKTLLSHRGHHERYASLAFSPDGKTLAVGEGSVSSDAAGYGVELWDTGTLEHRATLPGHLQDVDFVAFNPAGNALITRSKDGLKLWDAESISKEH
jgi:WD40 repeat protein/tRNA A-37 threonylcarbamoyl transferase component Bud32